jgi:methyl-accepting chemotaxis protein
MPKLHLSDFAIAQKLPAMIVASAVILAVSLSVSAYFSAKAEAEYEIDQRFAAALDAGGGSMQRYLKSIEEDLTITARAPSTFEALDAFTAGYAAMPNAEQTLKQLYIDENPHPLGEKHKLDAANDGSAYSQAHARFHGHFRTLLETRDYYDIFLFDRQGNLVYSVFKEADYATNLVRGEWASTDLGNAFQITSLANDPAAIVYFDFKPYAPSADAPASFIAAPLVRNGETVGVLAFQMPIDRINELMNSVSGLGKSGEVIILGKDRTFRNDSRFTQENDILKTTLQSPLIDQAFDGVDGSGTVEGYRGEPFRAAVKTIEYRGTNWALAVMETEAELAEPLIEMRNQMLMVAAGLLLLTALAGIVFARSITKPMVRLNDTMRLLADGDLDIDLVDSQRGDEIGLMSKAVEVFRDNAVERKRLESRSDEERLREEQRQARIEQIIAGFRGEVGEIMEHVGAATSQLESTSHALTGIADTTNHQVTTVAGGSEEASANVQTVAAAAEELASSIAEIDRQVTQTDQVVKQASEHASTTNAQVQRLTEAAQRIGDVIGMIQDIAAQTNLLALNATIEAARAGEAGKGFAVVASEVKTLADQTARATGDISEQISGIQADTQSAAQAIGAISDTMKEVDHYTAAIAAAVREQGNATGEISRNVQEAASGTQSVSETIAGVAEAANETSQSAGQLAMTVSDLTAVTDKLNGSVERFLDEVAAA